MAEKTALEELLSKRDLETTGTKGFDKLLKEFTSKEKKEFLALLRLSRDNLDVAVKSILTEVYIDIKCSDDEKVLKDKMYTTKNTAWHTYKRMCVINEIIEKLEKELGDEADGSDTKTAE